MERRRRLVELAAHYGVPILEDDPYGQLRYEGDHLPALVKLDAELHGSGRRRAPFHGGVIYLGTMSKILAPGLRIGWVVAPEEVRDRLVHMKQGVDLHTSTFNQMVTYETARVGFLDQHVRRLRTVYRERRDAMLAALERHCPPGVRWTRPQGGLFTWLTLPAGQNAQELLADALKEKVAFIPGPPFYPGAGGERSMRLNFSYCRPEVIEEGVRRLGQVVARRM
jgi:2-aminoadipate transaminase